MHYGRLQATKLARPLLASGGEMFSESQPGLGAQTLPAI